MLNLGLAILLAACAFLLSTLQEWALRGEARLVRHLLAWLAGTLLVSAVVGAVYRLVTFPHVAPGDRAPSLAAPVVTLFHWLVAVGVGAALAAGALHARQVGGDPHESARDRWVGRAVVQGITLVVVGCAGFFLLLLTALGTIH